MLLEWEKHSWSHSPNMPAELLELEGSGVCRAPVCAGLCAGSRLQSSTAPSPACTFPGSPERHRFPIISPWPLD